MPPQVTNAGVSMGVSLDLTKAHSSRHHGDILAIYTWMNDERALILIPAYRKNTPWFILCESAAYRYDDPIYLARQARKAAEVLGMEESTSTWANIATIIHDGLPDLIRMPSSPPKEYSRAAYGTMEVREDGKTIAQQDMRFETEGTSYG